MEEWAKLQRKVQKNDLRIFDGLTVSILRNGREVFAGSMPRITTRHSVTNWYRIQIDMPGELDEAFGIASNKQGVRLKDYVEEAIKDAIGGEITRLNDELKRVHGELSSERIPAKPTPAELRAAESDPFQRTQTPILTQDEEAQMNQNLRGLAVSLRRGDETEDDAFERVKASPYITDFKHDEYHPFYDVQQRFGRTILTVNTAHPFFVNLYEPLSRQIESEAGEDVGNATASGSTGPIVALNLLLLSLARTQGRLSGTGEDARKILDLLRREWSDVLRVQLSA
jgi:hypothetical protein